MLRNLAWMATGAVLLAGCTAKTESPVKYDPVNDTSSIYATIRESTDEAGGRPKPGDLRMAMMLTGDGIHPREWRGSLTVSYRNPEGEPDFWGERPGLLIEPLRPISESTWGTIRGFRNGIPEDEFAYDDDQVAFDVPIEKLVQLAEARGLFLLNGKEFRLTSEEQGKIRKAIVAAREDTNLAK